MLYKLYDGLGLGRNQSRAGLYLARLGLLDIKISNLGANPRPWKSKL